MQKMQHEKISRQLDDINILSRIKLSDCRTFHILDNIPLYRKRFNKIGKYHSPGFAPVTDQTGSYHINLKGEAAYSKKFDKSFGYYCTLAAVVKHGCYYHVDEKGHEIYNNKYDWVGNYQENKCVVRQGSSFFHIDRKGQKIYNDQYDYVGDFKDAVAVVYADGMASHIDSQGNLLHNKWYKTLGIYHKNFAIAEDNSGYFHIDSQGMPIYSSRYKTVEPFYNEYARAEEFSGRIGQINIFGEMEVIISNPSSLMVMHQISSELVGFWKTYLVNAAVQMNIFNLLPMTTTTLAQKLHITQENLHRFLRALWELQFITYDHKNSLWQLDKKGQFFIDNPFMQSAAKLWSRVIREEHWLKIPELLHQKQLISTPSFKESELDDDISTEFYQALLGYSAFDMNTFSKTIDIAPRAKLLLFGVHSLSLIQQLKKQNVTLLDYYNAPLLPIKLTDNFDINLVDNKQNLINKYDCAILARFCQHHDDLNIIHYLRYLKMCKIKRIIIIDTILEHDSACGGLVDMNIMVETGGKLRSISEWHSLMQKVGGIKIHQVLPLKEYLSIIEINNL